MLVTLREVCRRHDVASSCCAERSLCVTRLWSTFRILPVRRGDEPPRWSRMACEQGKRGYSATYGPHSWQCAKARTGLVAKSAEPVAVGSSSVSDHRPRRRSAFCWATSRRRRWVTSCSLAARVPGSSLSGGVRKRSLPSSAGIRPLHPATRPGWREKSGQVGSFGDPWIRSQMSRRCIGVRGGRLLPGVLDDLDRALVPWS